MDGGDWRSAGTLKAAIPFPITSGRFRSMTSDYITPMDRTTKACTPRPTR
jgi:hypothetical protein